MLRHCHSLLLLGSIALGAPLAAQHVVQTTGGPILRKVAAVAGGRPVLHVRYDVASDRITSIETISPDRHEVGTPCFDNSDFYLDDTYVVTDPGQEIVNWGLKNCPGASRLRSITLLYLSEARSGALGS